MKQPRVPEYREGENVGGYLKTLIRFLKDFSMNVWTAYRQTEKALGQMPEIEYPVTSVNGKTGAVTLAAGDVGALRKDAQAKDSASLGGKAPSHYLRKKNLLDNSNFANLIAQEGLMGLHGTVPYLADRWVASGADITAVQRDGYCSLRRTASRATITQRIPGDFAGKTLTIAAKVKCADTVFLGFCRHDGTKIENLSFGNPDGVIIYSKEIPSDADDVAVRIYLSYNNADADTDIYWVAVYEGKYTASTLPDYVPEDEDAALAECQKYYCKINSNNSIYGIAFGACHTATAVRLCLSLPQVMRLRVPDFSYQVNDGQIRIVSDNSYADVTDVQLHSCVGRNAYMIASATGMTQRATAMLMASNCIFRFFADL